MIVVAPDAFKGTFSAATVAAAVGRGVERAGVIARRVPLADGGEGTMSVLLTAFGGETRGALVSDPLGRPRRAGFALIEHGHTAIVEVAEAGGLPLVGVPSPSTAWSASSAGTGELLVAAAAAGASVILVAAGGSASTDGGAGALEAVSVPTQPGPTGTAAQVSRTVRASEPAGAAEKSGPIGAQVVVLCDVRTVWEDCPRVFGPQKGADPETVARLEARLAALAATLPRDPRGVVGGGAAGGLAGGLWAGLGAVLEPGAAWVCDALGLDEELEAAEALIVGEGALDATSAAGKAAGEACARARAAGVPAYAVVGRDDGDAALRELLGLRDVLVAGTLDALEAAGEAIARRAAPRGPQGPASGRG